MLLTIELEWQEHPDQGPRAEPEPGLVSQEAGSYNQDLLVKDKDIH